MGEGSLVVTNLVNDMLISISVVPTLGNVNMSFLGQEFIFHLSHECGTIGLPHNVHFSKSSLL